MVLVSVHTERQSSKRSTLQFSCLTEHHQVDGTSETTESRMAIAMVLVAHLIICALFTMNCQMRFLPDVLGKPSQPQCTCQPCMRTSSDRGASPRDGGRKRGLRRMVIVPRSL
ncbi:uncharacterized protein LOC119402006 [Rhipicephalus sanguineus]|uniref:uncharacterized protein LOC119402006 n=1 Tax=Rhipicephalus sanguineus TaxID=34632 RepID=UPI0018931CD7|nr:uncharacterized protein LOC119402006 [Rhipicephalus sanguineus]